MSIKRPLPKKKPSSNKIGPDVVQVLPITKDKELIIIELKLPLGVIAYRVIEEYFDPKIKTERMLEMLMSMSGLVSKKTRLLKKGQPFNIGGSSQDIAAYVFIVEQTEQVDKPKLNFSIPYSLKSIPLKEFNQLLDQGKIENWPLIISQSNYLNF